MNPTQGCSRRRLTALEGAAPRPSASPARSPSASGQSAETLAILNLAEAGDHLVSSPSLYGGTYNLFHYTLPKIGIEVTFVEDPDDLDQWRAAVRPNTKAFFGETLANPRNDMFDIEGVVRRRPRGRHPARSSTTPCPRPTSSARSSGAPTSSCTGHQVHRRPRHARSAASSSTVASSTSRASGRFPGFTEPDPSYHGLAYWPALGAGAYIIKARVQLLRDIGAAITPFNAFLILQGIETLSLRMERHFANAQKVAEFLDGPRQVSRSIYAGLPTARGTSGRQVRRRQGLRLDPRVHDQGWPGGRRKFVEALKLHSHVANIGDVRSLVIHPASTTHSQLTDEEQLARASTRAWCACRSASSRSTTSSPTSSRASPPAALGSAADCGGAGVTDERAVDVAPATEAGTVSPWPHRLRRAALVACWAVVVGLGAAARLAGRLRLTRPVAFTVLLQGLTPLAFLPVYVVAGLAVWRRRRVLTAAAALLVAAHLALVVPALGATSAPAWAAEAPRADDPQRQPLRREPDPAGASGCRVDADVLVLVEVNRARRSSKSWHRRSGTTGAMSSNERQHRGDLSTRSATRRVANSAFPQVVLDVYAAASPCTCVRRRRRMAR